MFPIKKEHRISNDLLLIAFLLNKNSVEARKSENFQIFNSGGEYTKDRFEIQGG
jgi:hypothetical protein